jgi:sarcosine/dimethylglycine N-methyltransferase
VSDTSRETCAVVEQAERYSDSRDADEFYHSIWGGEDIHIGLYSETRKDIAAASRATVELMADNLGDIGPDTRVLDLGAGYGGAARQLVRRSGCHVTCLNLSETQNRRNREKNAAQGLSERISVVHGNFEAIPFAASSFDVVWSQDAILHSGARAEVVAEVKRVLGPRGQFIFTDPMQAADCPESVLAPVLSRIHLDTLGSFRFYRATAEAAGMEVVNVLDMSDQLLKHYTRVREDLSSRYAEICALSASTYVDRMLQGLEAWTNAASRGYLEWGILHFRVR